MVAVDVALWVLAGVAVASGVAVFVVGSMARATWALALSFVAVGAAVLLLGMDYVGVVTVLMMVMEMAVMGVWMVMFMGMNPALMAMDMTHEPRRAGAAAAGVFAVLAAGALLVPWPVREGAGAPSGAAATATEVTRALGEALMGSKALVMVAFSPVVLATIVVAVVLSAPRTRYDRLGGDLRAPRARDPQPGGVGRTAPAPLRERP